MELFENISLVEKQKCLIEFYRQTNFRLGRKLFFLFVSDQQNWFVKRDLSVIRDKMSDSRKHVMLSYCWSSTRSHVVEQVANKLRAANIPIWMDTKNGVGDQLLEG